MKIQRLLFLLILVLSSCVSHAVDWVGTEKAGGIAYFFVSNPAQVRRYDTGGRTWLAPLALPVSRGSLTSATVDADGIYVAYDKAVYRYDLTGGSESHVINTVDTVQSLFTDGNLLLINHTAGYYARVMSVSKTTNTVISSMENYIDSIHGASIARDLNRIVGTTRGISPADVSYVEYRDDGTFVGGGDSPHHGDYNIGTRTWVFPNNGRFADTTGNVYSTTGLSHSLSFGTTVTDLAFSGDDVPIVLSGNKITAYTNTLLPAGSITLSQTAKTLLVVGTDVIAFRPTTGNDIALETVPLADLKAPVPGQPVDPKGLAFTPDSVFVDEFDIVYLFSKAHQTIFRWDAEKQAYLDGLPLIGAPEFVAYSSVNDRIYTAYASGLVRKIDLESDNRLETPFAQLPSAPLGLATAGAYVFASDGSGAWNTHYTYAPDGSLVSSKDWNYYSRSYVWSETNQKLYFFRDDTSPNDLIWEEINANGTTYPSLAHGAIGIYKDSPLHTSTGFSHPIKPSPDGTLVLLGSGMLHNGTTLERLSGALGNAVTDASWISKEIYSIRNVSTVTQLQQWTAPTYAMGAVKQLPGTPRRIITLSGNRLLAITTGTTDGIPSFYVLNPQFDILPAPTIAAPSGLVASLNASTQVQLDWQDVSGESLYKVERRILPSGAWEQIATTTVSLCTLLDPTVQVGNHYSYRVIALNGSVTSIPGDSVDIDLTVPAKPTLTISLESPSQIRLDWTASPGAGSYRLYRQTSPGSAWQTIATLTGDTLTYVDGSLSPGLSYSYRMQALNSLGASANSDVVTQATPITAPETPYLNTPSATGLNSVSLTWSAAARAESYRIERQAGTSGKWTTIATREAAYTGYIDQAVSPGTLYSYRVTAINPAGSSAASAVRSVTTPKPLSIHGSETVITVEGTYHLEGTNTSSTLSNGDTREKSTHVTKTISNSTILGTMYKRKLIPATDYSLVMVAQAHMEDGIKFFAIRKGASPVAVPEDLLSLQVGDGPAEGTLTVSRTAILKSMNYDTWNYTLLRVSKDFYGSGILIQTWTAKAVATSGASEMVELVQANGTFSGVVSSGSTKGVGILKLSLSNAKTVSLKTYGMLVPDTAEPAPTGSGSVSLSTSGSRLLTLDSATQSSSALMMSGSALVVGPVATIGGTVTINTLAGGAATGLVVAANGDITQLPTFSGAKPAKLIIITATGSHSYVPDANGNWALLPL